MKYAAWTVVLGLLAVPVGAGLWTIFTNTLLMNYSVWAAWTVAALSLVGVFAIWFRWARVGFMPSSPWRSLLPVMAPPTYFLLAWIVCFAVSPGMAAVYFATAGVPWSLNNLWALLTGQWIVIPVALVAVHAVTLAGFALGYRRRFTAPRHTGWSTRPARTALIGTVAASLVLTGVAAGQIGAYERYLAIPRVSDEVNLGLYQPFAPGNRLVVPPTKPSLQLSADFPRLDGATALFPVYAAMAQAVYVYPGDPVTQAANDVACGTTSGAYQRLIAGEVDAIFVAQPSQAQLTQAAAAGVELTLTPIGREAFVFFVNADNPVDGLTQQQVRDIYTKAVTNWRDLGGRAEPIQAFQRSEGSGSQTAMQAQVMKGAPMAAPRREDVAMGMGEVVHDVATYRNTAGAIGYTFRWYATVMNPNPAIKLLSIDGVAPTADNIRNGTYPLTSNFYVITDGPPTGTTASLVAWLRGPQGQALIEQVGYVGLAE